jgi:hypothetical protein
MHRVLALVGALVKKPDDETSSYGQVWRERLSAWSCG